MPTLTVSGLEEHLRGLGLKTPVPEFPAAHPLNNPLDIGRSYIADIVGGLAKCDTSLAYNSIQWPNNIYNGDLSVILPKLGQGKDRQAFATDLVEKFPKEGLFIRPFIDGVHLRLFLAPNVLPKLVIPYILDRKDTYGQDATIGLKIPSEPGSGSKKLVLEFSSPNLASQFLPKHLRSTILGAHIGTVYEAMGWEVVKLNYMGDWGKPIGLLGVGWDQYGSEEKFQEDPIGHFLEVYNKINEEFLPEQAMSKEIRDNGGDPAELESKGLFAKRNEFCMKMQDGDEQALAFSKRVRDVYIENYTKQYARLGVSFDEYSGESQVKPETMTEVEEILKSKGFLEETAGSLVVDMKKHTDKQGIAILRDRTGSRTYLLRDLAAVLERSRKYSFDKMIYVVAADNNLHFTRLFKILELMDMSDVAKKLEHVPFNESSKMFENLGSLHGLDEILDRCEAAMSESLRENSEQSALFENTPDVAKALGIKALVAQEVATRRGTEHVLDLAKMSSFESGTGAKLLYWYEKLGKLIEDNAEVTDFPTNDITSIATEPFSDLVRMLVQYPNITHIAYEAMEPAGIWAYLLSVVEAVSSCLENGDDDDENEEDEEGERQEKEKGEEDLTPTPAQVSLYRATRIVLENAMRLLRVNLK